MVQICTVGVRWPSAGCALYVGVDETDLSLVDVEKLGAMPDDSFDWKTVSGSVIVAAALLAHIRMPGEYYPMLREVLARTFVRQLPVDGFIVWNRTVKGWVAGQIAALERERQGGMTLGRREQL